MNVASLENCKRLYELSGWGYDCEHHWLDGEIFNRMPRQSDAEDETTYAPSYDAGYLLRKLPHMSNGGKWKLVVQKDWHNGHGSEYWFASYVHINSLAQFQPLEDQKSLHITEAPTPEDALCLLAIKLHEEGVLTKEVK